jgi:hypothetical protein
MSEIGVGCRPGRIRLLRKPCVNRKSPEMGGSRKDLRPFEPYNLPGPSGSTIYTKGSSVRVCRVPGHAKATGNEAPDQAAKRGAETP